MKIRLYKDSDYESVLKIAIEILGQDSDRMKKHLQKLIEQDEATVIVAVDKNTICGFISSFYTGWNRVAQIDLLAVDKGYQGQGIGKQLVQFIEQELKKLNIRKLYVDTGEDNVKAQIFYLKTGFKFEFVEQNFYPNEMNGVMLSKVLEVKSVLS